MADAVSGLSVWEWMALFGEGVMILTLGAKAASYAGAHNKIHETLKVQREEARLILENQRKEDLEKISHVDGRITQLWEQHDSTQKTCHIDVVEAKQSAVIDSLSGYQDEIRCLSGKVDRILGYLEAQKPGTHLK